MRTGKAPDRRQMTFDWNAAALTAATERAEKITDVEGEPHGHNRRDSAGGPPILLGEARPLGEPASGRSPESPGTGNADAAFTRRDDAGHASEGESRLQPEHSGGPSRRTG